MFPCRARFWMPVSPLTGLNGLGGIRESRALPWPDLFDAFSVGEITAPSASFAIIAGTCILLLRVGLVWKCDDLGLPKMKQ